MKSSPAENSRLGPYRLIEKIGRGGMGEVWRARDTRLDREVAIKLFTEKFTDRFDREARAIAALNHPNICTLYDVGPNYLVMELIDGPTLADRLADGPIPLDESLAIARQIADALEAAHEKNVVHRDLKPSNIKLCLNGVVKVLDFGLAKTIFPGGALSHDTPTLTIRHSPTQIGVILGTAAYMAPEQARGKNVDKRADIWSFGVVLCEMVTGKRLFEGEDLTDTLATVVKTDPDFAPVPYQVRRLLKKCLEKDPKKRLRDIGDAWDYLDSDERSEEKMGPPPSAPATATAVAIPGRPLLWPVIAAIFALAATTLAVLHFREKPAPQVRALRFQIHLPPDIKLERIGAPRLSPNGRYLAFAAYNAAGIPHLFIQDMEGGAARELSNTRISNTLPPVWWSPDSNYLAFSGYSAVERVEVASGQVRPVCDKPGPAIGGMWTRDGVIVFGSLNSGLWRAPAAGGKAVLLTQLDTALHQTSHQLPELLPDGRHYIFMATSSDTARQGVYARSIDDPPEKPSVVVVSTPFAGSFISDPDGKSGRLLFVRESSLVSQPFDLSRLALTGNPSDSRAPVATAFQTPLFTASPQLLIFRGGGQKSKGVLTWIDAKNGKVLNTVGTPGVISDPSLSPDGKRVAYEKAGGDLFDIWILDLERGTETRLTSNNRDHTTPVWSPDSSEIIYSEQIDGLWQMFRAKVNGTAVPELVRAEPRTSLHADSWSPDGRFLLFNRSASTSWTAEKVAVLPLEKGAEPVLFSSPSTFTESWPTFSPDGHYVAYASTDTGSYLVYVRTFEQNPGGQPVGKWTISSGEAARSPQWTKDGKMLVWYQNKSVWGVTVNFTGGFHPGPPTRLYDIPDLMDAAAFSTPDGKGLIVNPASTSTDEPINVIVNWMK